MTSFHDTKPSRRGLPTRWQRKLPGPVRRNWRLLLATLVALGLATTVFAGVSIRPYVTSAAVDETDGITHTIEGAVDLFDAQTEHEITVQWRQEAYDQMLDSYFADGEKDWFAATVTIDGTTIDNVAVRLKGNSTLSGLTDDRPGGDGKPADGGIDIGGGQMPENIPEDIRKNLPDQIPDGLGIGSELSTETPEELPLLLSLNEYEPGRSYQGLTQLSVRPALKTYPSAINEALALDLTAASGQRSQRYTYSRYTVNDRPTTTRLVIEVPDAGYAAEMGQGVLYKVRAGAQFAYQGEDQTDYSDEFQQINLTGTQDLQPIIEFLGWLADASQEEFDEELHEWVDVDSLAEYVATQNILENMDSLSGPGSNGYLWYDHTTGKISVISWDLNLAFGGMGNIGDMGGGGMELPEGIELPEGMELPEDLELPEGAEMPADPDQQDDAPRRDEQDAGGMMGGLGAMMGNDLIDRLKSSETHKKAIAAAQTKFQKTQFDTGTAARRLTTIVDSIPVTDGLDAAAIRRDEKALRKSLTVADKNG